MLKVDITKTPSTENRVKQKLSEEQKRVLQKFMQKYSDSVIAMLWLAIVWVGYFIFMCILEMQHGWVKTTVVDGDPMAFAWLFFWIIGFAFLGMFAFVMASFIWWVLSGKAHGSIY